MQHLGEYKQHTILFKVTFFIYINFIYFSTLSTSLNTLCGTLYEDFIKQNLKNDDNAHIIMKALVLLIGCISVVMVLFIEKMGKILSVNIKLLKF